MRMMCVVAHPDDECFGFGGALALAAEQGIATYVLCLTDGQAATHRGEARSDADLGRMRAEEFRASCDVLGVTQHEMLHQRDGQLEFADFSALAGQLVQRMRAFQPDVVLSFGLDGGLNTHADHMMVAMLTSAAFHWAGRTQRYPEAGVAFQPKRLFVLSTDRGLPDRQAPYPMPWSLRLDIRRVLPRKMEAFRAHRSQAPLMEKTRTFFEEHGGWEFYSLLADAEPRETQVLEGFFSGL